ncbi:MAG: hypothetical protein BRC40_02400 [Cyanobacteria bacterium QH_8_48_120]|jgi:small multidrug resistance pump|nr:MAG: hypothetical protein BRC34_09335 [Cyanobacteria bacterium QH_1_48_107]PSO57678.1 MAG: hypothetical protein BRC39_14420 [Cyanobacteria bacterium QH_7_48_89]PSO69767.1 MAG: hypothetical protein BRC42_11245 [Cyanobacteria bacterium QS_1_48_34]PSO77005.1 MAG: hypothetical protein BRC40_02400 [Cyanobacteria bacterium QH_8_48_120]PSO94394.1 MAG: hypothetical protein BRC48_10615 [Cyanobacteria bacterium QS_9_48_30]
MSWIYLCLAIVFEVSGTTSMKLSQGFANIVPSISMIVFYALSLSFLTLAVKTIDVGVAYATWTGLGTALIATIGIVWFKEPATALKLISLSLIIIGAISLNQSGANH